MPLIFYLQPVKPGVTSEMSNSQSEGIYCKKYNSQFWLVKQTYGGFLDLYNDGIQPEAV